jgi:2-polyprenyl-6-methoxyphenol hydroxylase-like FAD-dependent oxidoreductase
VGAYVLACELAEAKGAHREAFAAYQRRMQPFAELNQQRALERADGFAPKSAFGLWLLNLNFKLLPYLPWGELVFKWVFNGIARAAKAIELPEHAAVLLQTNSGPPGLAANAVGSA